MHELSVTQRILGIALDTAQKAGATKINKIKIAVGEMTGYLPKYVQEYFNILSKDTIAKDAKLEFIRISAAALCNDCGSETRLEGFKFVCSHCQSQNLKLIHGREFLVDSIDVD